MQNARQKKEFAALTVADIADKLMSGKRALIISHVNPDGDAVGSMFALKALCEAAGGSAVCKTSNEAPFRLRFLQDDQETLSEGFSQYDYAFSVDIPSRNQFGQLEYMADMCDFMIDHHEKGSQFAPGLIDPTASAAGEIVYDIALELEARGVQIPPRAFAAMYAAISADTGSFKYSNATPKTYRIAADLVERLTAANYYPDHSEIARCIHDSRTMGELEVMRIAIEETRFFAEGALAVLVLTRDMIEDAELAEEDLGNTVEIPRSIEGVLVAVSVKQSADDRFSWRLSCRSNCSFDVGKICAELSGGGHERAAGGRIFAKSAKEAEDAVLDAFENELLKWMDENDA